MSSAKKNRRTSLNGGPKRGSSNTAAVILPSSATAISDRRLRREIAFECLKEMDVDQLFSIFENSFKAHLHYRAPDQDVNEVLSEARQHTTKEQLLKLARHMPSVVAAATSEGSSGYSSSKGAGSRSGSWESQSPTPASITVKRASTPPRRHSVGTREILMREALQGPSESSPPPSYETALQGPKGSMSPTATFPTTPSAQTPTNADAVMASNGPPPASAIDISTLQIDPTVLNGLYIKGRGRNKTIETPFEVSEENYVRALAWTRRGFAFDRANEHLAYHFKILLLKDVQALLETLEKNGFGPPPSPQDPGDGSKRSQAQYASLIQDYRRQQSEYDHRLSQIIFTLPTHWPPKAHFWADLNKTQSVTMSPKYWCEPNSSVDVTEMVKKGPNTLTVVEVQDLQHYVFCLFEKYPSEGELESL